MWQEKNSEKWTEDEVADAKREFVKRGVKFTCDFVTDEAELMW